DPAIIVEPSLNNNALHELCMRFIVRGPDSWPCKLFELFIAHGVSVHERDIDASTPLLAHAASAREDRTSANALLLLLAHGADLNAQDGQGDGVLHHLVERGASDMLRHLTSDLRAGLLDLHLVNSAGQT